ncbi:MAG: pilus assembly protein TadG-related protein [Pseudomonadota bacterium]
MWASTWVRRVYRRFFSPRSGCGFLTNARGSAAIIFALSVPALLGGTALAIDFAYLSNQRERLQHLADAASVAAAHELSLANVSKAQIRAAARNYIRATHKLSDVTNSPIRVNVDVDIQNASVNVVLKQVWSPFFAHMLNDVANPIGVSATARILGQGAVCVLGLNDANDTASIHIDNDARLEAPECTVYSNATHKKSIQLDQGSSLEAASICAAGGVLGKARHKVQPNPLSDCPQLDDPLAHRPPLAIGACDHRDFEANSGGNVTLRPGVYCGGLTVSGTTVANLMPGEYIIKEGRLRVVDSASLIGTGVGFYLTGGNSVFRFHRDTTISLEAPTSGPLAGLLIYEDPNVPHNINFSDGDVYRQPPRVRAHTITSDDARMFVGTFYLPKSIMFIASKAAVADRSAFTAIVAGRLWLKDGPTLTINSDYDLTEVPLPQSLAGGIIALSE